MADNNPQPLDLDAIEARANVRATLHPLEHIASLRNDIAALIAEVKRLRGELADVWDEGYTVGNRHNGRRDANPYRAPQPQHEHEWAYDRTLCGICGGNHGYCECGETEPCDPPAPQPDPLDENDHRDRVDQNGRTWSRLPDGCWASEAVWRHFTVAEVASYFGPLAFADDPQTPQEATSGTETALNHAALAEVAEQAHRLSQAICDLLDGDPGFYTAPDTCQRILNPREHR